MNDNSTLLGEMISRASSSQDSRGMIAPYTGKSGSRWLNQSPQMKDGLKSTTTFFSEPAPLVAVLGEQFVGFARAP